MHQATADRLPDEFAAQLDHGAQLIAHGNWLQSRRLHARLVVQARSQSPRSLPTALVGLAETTRATGRIPAALHLYQEAALRYREVGMILEARACLRIACEIQLDRGDASGASAILQTLAHGRDTLALWGRLHHLRGEVRQFRTVARRIRSTGATLTADEQLVVALDDLQHGFTGRAAELLQRAMRLAAERWDVYAMHRIGQVQEALRGATGA